MLNDLACSLTMCIRRNIKIVALVSLGQPPISNGMPPRLSPQLPEHMYFRCFAESHPVSFMHEQMRRGRLKRESPPSIQ